MRHTKKVLELTLRESLTLGHDYIGTEHILLGLVRENEGVAAHILLDFDADSEKIRNEVIRLVPPATRPEEAEPRPAPDDKWDHLLVLLERANDTLDRIYEVLRKSPPGGG
jgi:ATP-dependent Clp protease ATP-binding subunit ClpA